LSVLVSAALGMAHQVRGHQYLSLFAVHKKAQQCQCAL
jgi:hypothetical protein